MHFPPVSNHKYLVLHALVLLHIPALVELTAICPGKVGSIIDHHRPLAFEALIHFR